MADEIKFSENGTQFTLLYKDEKIPFETRLLGELNISKISFHPAEVFVVVILQLNFKFFGFFWFINSLIKSISLWLSLLPLSILFCKYILLLFMILFSLACKLYNF